MERVKLIGAKRPKYGGRVAGVKNKTSVLMESVLRAKEDGGLLPHEILLHVARGGSIKVGEEQVEKWPDMEMQMEAAKAAAPYYAPKLSTVEVIKGMDDHALDETIAGLAAQAGITITIGREGQTATIEVSGNAEQGTHSPTDRRTLVPTRNSWPSAERLKEAG